MKTTITGLAASLLCAAGMAQTAPASAPATTTERPVTKAGDTWTYRNTKETAPNGWTQTRDDVTVTRVTASSIYLTTHESGSSQPPKDMFVGADWSRVRAVNGKETVVNQPLAFPLAAGKTWTLHYREEHPNKAHRYEEWNSRYTVVGTEKVTVPAGTFDAIKIEAEGTWAAELEPGSSVAQGAQAGGGAVSMQTEVRKVSADPVGGRTYKALWYAPEVHRWVKSVEEYYAAGGVRNERYSSELESFKLVN